MPYIEQPKRLELKSRRAQNAGELNFVITTLVNKYLNFKGKNYASYNEVIGALECAKLELYRRLAAPYEDTKVKMNGDVYHE